MQIQVRTEHASPGPETRAAVARLDILLQRAEWLVAAIRQRDNREPGAGRKHRFEQLMAAALLSLFRKQKAAVRQRLEQSGIKINPSEQYPLPFDESFWSEQEAQMRAELLRIFLDEVRDGVLLFSETVEIGVDFSIVNIRAAAWARKHVGDLIKDITDTTLAALREAVAQFIETPGFTLRDIMSALPYDENRALMIAVTETTRAYAEANLLAGEELVKQFPDVQVIKIWNTNNDDRVCPICIPLDGKHADIHRAFGGGIDIPPAHVGCRCWMMVTTKLAKL